MKSLSWQARLYILVVSLLGTGALLSQLGAIGNVHSWLMLAACCALAAPLQVLKIEGVTARTSYNLGWIIYGFAFVNLGAPAAVLVVLVAHIVEWLRYRYPWYIQLFNVASFSLAFWLMDAVTNTLDPQWAPPQATATALLILVFALLTILNHFLVGCAIYLARGQSLAESGVLAPEAVLIDFGLLGLGAVAASVWLADPAALLFVALVVYLLYRALLVPALQRQAEVDPKTNVYNMAYFMGRMADEFNRAQRTGRPLTVVMADLDHLREVNNVHGHLAGDVAIQAVAGCLTSHSRSHDVVARFGGEEFVILMPDTEAAAALPLVETMRAAIGKLRLQADADAPAFHITMSFGVAQCCAGEPPTVKELIEQADQALYQAKRLGRNQACRYDAAAGPASLPPDLRPDAAAMPGATPAHGATALPGAAQMRADTATPGGRATPGSPPRADTLRPPDTMPRADGTVPHAGAPAGVPPPAAAGSQAPAWAMPVLVAGLAAVTATLALVLLAQSGAPDWLGIAAFTALAIGAEGANIELYARHTSVSTSVAALLAGVLLFGAPAALCIGAGIALAAWLKYRSPPVRLLFNSCNHVLGGILCVLILTAAGPLAAWPLLVQVALAVVCGLVIYLSSTTLVALAIGFTTGQCPLAIWRARFQWLGLHYVGLSFVAFGLFSTYPDVGPLGILIVLLPLAVIRYGQKQYIDATDAMVNKLQGTNRELQQQKQELKRRNGEMLRLLAAALDLRDPSVQSHSEQVAMYATAMARQLDLPPARIELVRQAALLHDIGKLAVPDSVLYKSERLTPEEYTAIKGHPVVGAGLLRQFMSLDAVADFVLYHHEHFDGTGYPAGLQGEQIPLEARIVGLADAVEAMASARPYQPALPVADIRAELQRCSGTQFDPQIVAAFFAVLARRGDDALIDTARPSRTLDTASTRILPTCMPAATN